MRTRAAARVFTSRRFAYKRDMTRSAENSTGPADAGPLRLSKFLADAGVASRRHAEEMILAGRVTVNDEVVSTLPAFVRTGDSVTFDGRPVRAQRIEYWIVHKPKGVLCTNNDPDNRPRVFDLLPPHAARVFPVGRLDMEDMGLLLLTNDGELAQRLTHPRFGIAKVYRAEVVGRVGRELPTTLRDGVWLSDGKARAGGVEIVHVGREESVLDITLREGRNRQVRRMLAHCGHKVRRLTRIAIGPILLKGLPLGASRLLSRGEVSALKQAIEENRAGVRIVTRSASSEDDVAKHQHDTGERRGGVREMGTSRRAKSRFTPRRGGPAAGNAARPKRGGAGQISGSRPRRFSPRPGRGGSSR